MSSLNKVMIIGRLCADPELKKLPSGTSVCNMRVATSVRNKEGVETATFHTVTAFEALADQCANFLTKGRLVYIEGSIVNRSWEKDGEKRYSTEVRANRVDFLGPKPAEAGSADGPESAPHKPAHTTSRPAPKKPAADEGGGQGSTPTDDMPW